MKIPPCPFPKSYPSQLQKDHQFYMQNAYNQAVDGWNSGEVPVGAVVRHADQIISSAHNQTRMHKDPTAHAEMIALTMAAKHIGDWRLNECILYVTKEPCPMCSGAIIMARMGEVHYAFKDPKMGCLGGAVSLHTLPESNHKPIISTGLLSSECHELVRSFFKLQR